MAQPVYPTLSIEPVREGFTKQPAFDPTIRTSFEDGSYQVLAKTTNVPYMWSFHYRYLSVADKETLMSFYEDDANYGAVVIKWTDPSNDTDVFVHFATPPNCTLENDSTIEWQVEVSFVEAIGTYT